jgi:hypothetical protein
MKIYVAQLYNIYYTNRKVVLEHQATVAKLGAHMGLRHQLGSQVQLSYP